MVNIILNKNEDGYDQVGNYIHKFWKHRPYPTNVIVSLAISHDGNKWYYSKEFASPQWHSYKDDIIFDMDWWEGEKFIRIYGIVAVEDLEIEGGLYED